MRGRGVAVVRAVGALLLTLALVVGVPALLVFTVGNPFPSEIPSLDEIRVTLTQNGEGFGRFLMSALAVLIWFVWLQLVVALVFEVIATSRQRETRRLPTAPAIQTLAARLVAAMTLATTLATAPLLAPAIGALDLDGYEPVMASEIVHQSIDATVLSLVGQAGSGVDTPTGVTTVILAESTELWDLADSAYGDGVLWKSIAQSNAGVADSEGRVITSDTESLPAGTSVVLPAPVDVASVAAHGVIPTGEAAESDTGEMLDGRSSMVDPAVGDGSASNDTVDDRADDVAEVDVSDAIHVVEAGDSMWSVAEAEVEQRVGHAPSEAEIADYWVEVVDANRDVPSGDVDLIHPGDRLVIPGGGDRVDGDDAAGFVAPAPTVPDGPVELATGVTAEQRTADEPATADRAEHPLADGIARSGSDATAPSADEPATADISVPPPVDGAETIEPAVVDAADEGADQGTPLVPFTMAAFGAALLATGVHGALQRRRALQRRLREPGTLPRLPSTEAAAFEAALAHAASDVIESELGNGWRLLPASAVASVQASGPVELHADRDGALVAVPLSDRPASPNGADAAIDLVEPPDGETLAATLGTPVTWHADSPEPGEAVLPTSTILGTHDVTGEAVMLDLASAGLVDLQGTNTDLQRVVEGIVLDLAVSDRADDLCVIGVGAREAFADLERVRPADSLAGALTAALRCGHASPDSSTPVVVVSEQSAADAADVVDALRTVGAIVVAPGLADAPVRVTVDGDQASVWPSGTTLGLAAPDIDGRRAVAELVEVTAIGAVEPFEAGIDVIDQVDVPVVDACAVEPGPIEVKVLGPVEIAGAGSFSSVKAVDVITYLAFHRHGVDADQIKSWVWPAFEPPTDKAFANVLSRARTALGVDGDGSPFLSRAGADKTYRLSDAVTTDFDRVRVLVNRADHAGDRHHELELLKQALELIRGVPFSGGAGSSFAWTDNHVRAHVEYTLDEAVHRCADLGLELEDLASARWAALKGLEVVPGCEQCFRRRFLVAGAGNNRTELRRAMADLERTAAAELGEPEAVDTISGELLELYNELDRALMAGSA